MAFGKRNSAKPATEAESPSQPMRATAQQLFDDMLAQGLRPRLREVGFRGSGTTFNWPAKDAWLFVGIQKSSGNTRDQVKFTANVSVTTKAEWESKRVEWSFLGDKPSPNAHPWGWGARIGQLMPVQTDYWWVLRTGDDWTAGAQELLQAIETVALPRMLTELESKRRSQPTGSA